MASDSHEISELLRELGYEQREHQARARAALEQAGLTRAGKRRIARAKRQRIEALLRQTLPVSCGSDHCTEALLRDMAGQEVITASRSECCHRCGGSSARRGCALLIAALARRKVRELVVVGGSPRSREQLANLLGQAVTLTLIDGTRRRTRDQARDDRARADLVVVWATTQLEHKVSNLYTAAATPRETALVIAVKRRGVGSLAEDLVVRLEQLAATEQQVAGHDARESGRSRRRASRSSRAHRRRSSQH